MRKNYCAYIFIFSVILLNLFILFTLTKTRNNQEDFFRLHIVANSNSIDDQIVKLKVSKKVTNYINTLLNNDSYTNKNYAKEKITENIDEILEIANNEMKKNNTNYSAYANIGKISYDEKYSEQIDMEKGIYDSVQIVLGEGKGENFWSLIFPSVYINYEEENISDYYNNEIKSNIIIKDNIEIKSGILEDIKKVVKLFS